SAARSAPGSPGETDPRRPERLSPAVEWLCRPRSPGGPGTIDHFYLPLFANFETGSRTPLLRQARQHLLHRSHRGAELFGIAGADDPIFIGFLFFAQKRIAADDGGGMGIGDLPQRPADVAFPGIGADRV